MSSPEKEVIQKIIGSTIRKLRTENKIHRDVFASNIEIEGGHLYRLEEGFHAPNCHIIRNICIKYGISADQLLQIPRSLK